MLGDQEEVKPVPLGDSVVQHCPRSGVVGILASQGEDPRVNPLLHDDKPEAGSVVCRDVSEGVTELLCLVPEEYVTRVANRKSRQKQTWPQCSTASPRRHL